MKAKTLKKNSVSPLTSALRTVRFDTMTPGKREKERKSNMKAVILTVFRLHKVAPAGNRCYLIKVPTFISDPILVMKILGKF